MIAVSEVPGPKFATEVVVEELDLSGANPDAGVPVRPGADKAAPPAPNPEPVIVPMAPPTVPSTGGMGKWLLLLLPVLAGGVYYANKRKAVR
jgi:hypothetical protein